MSEIEVPLTGGFITPGVVRIGNTVRRPLKSNASFVHALLLHLEVNGFTAAPRFLGIDAQGREMPSFIEGKVPPNLNEWTDAQLVAAAKLIRAFHVRNMVAWVKAAQRGLFAGLAPGGGNDDHLRRATVWAGNCLRWTEANESELMGAINTNMQCGFALHRRIIAPFKDSDREE